MITDIQVQHELLKTALEATDNYLFIEKRAAEAGQATSAMVHEFTYEMSRAHDALQTLGVLDQHQPYMDTHVQAIAKLYGYPTSTLLNQPYAHVPASDYGEVDESKEFWDSAKERADEPKEKLSPAWKAKAKARAAAAGRKYPNMVDNVWAAQKQESILVSFANFITEENDELTFSDDEITEMVETLSWDDIIDLYPEEDLIEEDELLDEALTAQARLKKRQSFARVKSKRFTAKRIKLRRASTPAILQKRAQLAARRFIYQRFLRGRDKSTMSASEKDRIEKQVKSMKSIQSSIATRMVPKIRSIEQKRLAHYRSAGQK
jgi:hypothetical protein